MRKLWGWFAAIVVTLGAGILAFAVAFSRGKREGRSTQKFDDRKQEIENADRETLERDLDKTLQ